MADSRTSECLAYGPSRHVAAAVRPVVAASGAAWLELSGLLSLAVAMGIGRFAFTPLLPVMLHDGGLSLAEGGWLAMLNYLGYFAGALLCMFIRPDPARAMRAGLLATVLLTFGMALPGGMVYWSLMRAAAGVASAVVMVFTATWCSQRLAEMGKPERGGLIYCGPGIGIVATGLLTFAMVGAGWHAGWGWAAHSVLAAILVASVWRMLVTPRASSAHEPGRAMNTEGTPRLGIDAWTLTLGYGLAGFGYIITATYLPVIARQALPGTLWSELFWPIFGVGVALGALVAARTSAKRDNRRLLALAHLTQAIGVVTVVVWPTAIGLGLSSLLVGLPFTAIVAFAVREARRLRGQHASSLVGLMTASYGLGQIAGPPLASVLVASHGGFASSLGCAAAALLAGAAIFLLPSSRSAVSR